ncbi:MAG: phosphopyruvate hydratase [Halobacteriales archaeon]
MTAITRVRAWEVLDSRGDPTVRVGVEVDGGQARGTFTVPAGASTGAHEVVEVRDGGDRYGGRGVSAAVEAVEGDLAAAVEGHEVTDQAGIDAALREADGAADLSRLGGNAVLGVSGAVAHAAADALAIPLYEYLAAVAGRSPGALPLPRVNMISGGLHAEGGIAIQDFLAVPVGAGSYRETLETAWDVRHALRERVLARGERPLVADEGGFAPDLGSIEAAFDMVEAAISDAGHEPSRDDVALAVDVAATQFWDPDAGRYELASREGDLTPAAMRDLVAGWVEERPIVSVEDPLAEDDWEGWARLSGRLPCQLVGDDLLATNPDRLERAIETGAADAVLLKPNQAGTLTRAIRTAAEATDAGMDVVVSARSGETCDTTIADLAVALGADEIKIGSLARSERLAKYNRLLRIGVSIDAFADPSFGS